jgi:hypothetical protein
MQWHDGFSCRLLARAHQPRRQGTHTGARHQGRLRRPRSHARKGRAALYGAVIDRGRAPRLQHQGAEAAKVIENTQRDFNIALMNELAIIFGKIGIDYHRSAGSRRHQVELPQIQAGPCRRPLHRRRPLLPHTQGRHARLSPAGDPRRPPHQRRHGQVRR